MEDTVYVIQFDGSTVFVSWIYSYYSG